jgi:ABC-type multidrug transport system fused ATPase/permease subunit
LAISILFASISGGFAVMVQFLKGRILDNALAKSSSLVISSGLLLILCVVIEILSYYFFDVFRSKYSTNCMKAIRKDFFSSILSGSYSKTRHKDQGAYISEFTNQIELVNNSYIAVFPLLSEIIIKIVIVSVSLFILDYRLAILTLILLSMPLYVPKIIESRLNQAQNESLDASNALLAKVVNWLGLLELIKSANIENKILTRFEFFNEINRDKAYLMRKISSISRSISTALSYFSHIFILLLAASFVLSGHFSAGSFFVAIGLIDQLSYPIISVSEYIKEILSTKTIAKDLAAKCNLVSEEPPDKKRIECIQSIEFDHVSFGYSDQNMLFKDLNFLVRKGEHCLIQGDNGKGKTTLFNLLLGYIFPQKGKIQINGIDQSGLNHANEFISIMRQDSVFFIDTLRNNLTLYSEKTDDEIFAVLKLVNLEKFATPAELEKIFRDDYSGGEKRRLSLARALLQNRPVLLLDEPFANIDASSIETIENLILNMPEKIVVLITHSLSKNKLDLFDVSINL